MSSRRRTDTDRWEHARVGLTLRPGDKGTKKLVEQYGEQLVRVRYRYDEAALKRYRTVELVLDTADWAPPPGPPGDEPVVFIQVQWGELQLGKLLRTAGARWYPRCGLWAVPLGAIAELGLEQRVIGPGPSCPRADEDPRQGQHWQRVVSGSGAAKRPARSSELGGAGEGSPDSGDKPFRLPPLFLRCE